MTSARDSENTKEVGDVTGGSQLCTKFTSTFLVVTQSFSLLCFFFVVCRHPICLSVLFLSPSQEGESGGGHFFPKGQKVRVTELLLPSFSFPP